MVDAARMEAYDVMRTTFAAREYTGDPIDDATLYRILDHARFAPSGGNRQGWKVIVVREPATRRKIAELARPAAQRYIAQLVAGENPFNTIHPTRLDAAMIRDTEVPPALFQPILDAAVVLVVCVDLEVVASMDAGLDRVGITSGASIYPFAWNILLAARNEGYGGVLTTFATAAEPAVQDLLGLPSTIAVATVLPLGRPRRQLTRLKRKPVSSFAVLESWNGDPLKVTSA